MQNKKIDYIHYIRGMAIFSIVTTHCNLFIMDDSLIGKVWSEILKEWTAVFLLISGFLFQHLLPRYQVKKFYFGRFKNVLLPYLIVSVPAMLIYFLGVKKEHNWVDIEKLMLHSCLYVVIFFYATGSHLGPLWFIPMLFLIFLTSVPLKYLGENERLLKYAAFFSIGLIFYTSRPTGDSNAFYSYIHFLPVYILGMFICQYKDVLVRNNNKWYFLISFILLFSVRVFFDVTPSVSILSKVFLFLFLCIILSSAERNIFTVTLSRLASASFSIYFIHGYFVGVIRKEVELLTSFPVSSNVLYEIFASLFFSSLIIAIISMVLYFLKQVNINTRIVLGS